MTTGQETDVESTGADTPQEAAQSAAQQVRAQMQPLFVLVAATLQAAGTNCPCETCLLLRKKAGTLVPMVNLFIGGE